MLIAQQDPPTIMRQILDSGLVPIRMVDIELGQRLPSISAFDEETGQCYQYAKCLVRLHTQPIGIIELQLNKNTVNGQEYVQQIWLTLGEQINEHLVQDGLSPVTDLDVEGLSSHGTPRCIKAREQFLVNAPFVSVIVPTHDRPEQLSICLRSLMSLIYPRYEVIIVDNAPGTNATVNLIKQKYCAESQVRYIREDRPGPSWARNCGMKVAKGEILAFTDDDVVVDPYWLVELVRAFTIANDVVCVTGLVLPLELETAAQLLFEEYGGFTKGLARRIFEKRQRSSKMPLHPYVAGRFGTGASMAFTATFLQSIGGFDPALGGNGPSRNGQDIAVFFQVIIRGYKLVYEPASLLYHLHRRDYAGLRKQIYNYGVGFTAFLMKSLLENPLILFDLLTKVPYGLFFILSTRSPKNSKKSKSYPKELTTLERKGMMYGPLAYLRSRRIVYQTLKACRSVESYSVPSAPKEFCHSENITSMD